MKENTQILTVYNHIIQKLKQGLRPQLKLSNEQWSELLRKWEKDSQEDKNLLHPLICISAHATSPFPHGLMKLITQELLESSNDEITILLLGICDKVIITESGKRGEKPSPDFFKALKNLLNSSNTEVQLWSLKALLESPTSTVLSAADFEKIKRLSFFDKNQKELKALRQKLIEKYQYLPSF